MNRDGKLITLKNFNEKHEKGSDNLDIKYKILKNLGRKKN